MGGSPPGFSVHALLQARTLGWVVIHFSMGSQTIGYDWETFASLLQGVILTQGLNPCLLPCRRILYRLSHSLDMCKMMLSLHCNQLSFSFVIPLFTGWTGWGGDDCSFLLQRPKSSKNGCCLEKKGKKRKWSCSVVADSCNPKDHSPPGSFIHGIFQARALEWVAISFSRGTSRPRDRTWVSLIAGMCFTVWATRGAPKREGPLQNTRQPQLSFHGNVKQA